MKKNNIQLNLIKYIGNIFTTKRPLKKYNRPEKHEPSWMYRND